MGALYGASALCGIGLTVDWFIGFLAFQSVGAEKVFNGRLD